MKARVKGCLLLQEGIEGCMSYDQKYPQKIPQKTHQKAQQMMAQNTPPKSHRQSPSADHLPDVSGESYIKSKPGTKGSETAIDNRVSGLAWVGMQNIPLQILLPFEGKEILVLANAHAQVSLNKGSSRGIHMSRLYEALDLHLALKTLSLQSMNKVTQLFLESHRDLSSKARLVLEFSLPIIKATLKSQRTTKRYFKFRLQALRSESGKTQLLVETIVDYSSTCPASMALSGALNADTFAKNFADRELILEEVKDWLKSHESGIATPHAQRSLAKIKVAVTEDFNYTLLPLWVEEALGTAVQTMVKREDEQEFARLNGMNPMFCEDAARLVSEKLRREPQVLSLNARFVHIESLHPHDAVAEIKWKKTICES